MPGLVLVALSLGFMLFRVTSPIGAKAEGKVIRQVELNVRERLAMQQINLCALAVILLLGSLGHWMRLPFELLAIVAAFGIITIPVRYRFTAVGVGLNRVVFRRWDEFERVETKPQRLVLIGRPGNGRFPIWVRGPHQSEVLHLVQRYLSASRRSGDVEPIAKGGPEEGQMPIRRLLARRS
jgi:hypothetical protein